MGLLRTTIGILSLFLAFQTHALTLDCDNEDSLVIYMDQLVAGAKPRTLNIVAADGEVQHTLEVLGHPLNPTIHLVTADGNSQNCDPVGDVTVLYEKIMTDPNHIAAISQWKAWKDARPLACDDVFDSIGYFQPADEGKPNKLAIVFHGVSSNPRAMEPAIRLLLDAGYSVIAPRLARHFDKRIKDLDHADFHEWLDDSEDIMKIAMQFSGDRRVTMLGYSLGGFLSTRLAFKYPEHVERAVLIAPAWYVGAAGSGGGRLGFIFGKTLNDFLHIPPACKAGNGYLPPRAGIQVENMTISSPAEFKGGQIPYIVVPNLVITSDADIAIDVLKVSNACSGNPSHCTQVRIHGISHSDMLKSLQTVTEDPNRSVSDAINDFINPPQDTGG